MEPRHTSTSTMIIAERGSAWAGWVERQRPGGSELVAQRPDESLPAFAARVRARVTELERDGVALGEAVLVGGGRSDADALQARSLVLRAVASHMGRHDGGRVLLEHHGSDRFAMYGLATTVASMVRGSGVSVAPADEAPDVRRVA